MMNHFMKFSDEATAKVVLAAYTIDGEWDLSRVIPGQRVVLARAEWDDSDPENPVQISPPVHMPGYFVTVSLPAIDADLRDLPDNACRLIGDSTAGGLVYNAPDLDTDLLATAIIEPVPAGARYSFGGAA
jgi:hypothetical protein